MAVVFGTRRMKFFRDVNRQSEWIDRARIEKSRRALPLRRARDSDKWEWERKLSTKSRGESANSARDYLRQTPKMPKTYKREKINLIPENSSS
jgi:hypothetical protein